MALNLGTFGTSGALGGASESSQISVSEVDYGALSIFDAYHNAAAVYVASISSNGDSLFNNRVALINQYFDAAEDLATSTADSQISEVNQRYDSNVGSVGAQTVATGMYNSTIGETLRSSINRERSQALLAINDAVAQLRIGLATQRSVAFERPHSDQINYLSQVGSYGTAIHTNRATNLPTKSQSSANSASISR